MSQDEHKVTLQISIGAAYLEALALLKLLDRDPQNRRNPKFSAGHLAGQVVENYIQDAFPDVAGGLQFGEWVRRRRAGEQFTVFDGEVVSAQEAAVMQGEAASA